MTPADAPLVRCPVCGCLIVPGTVCVRCATNGGKA